MPTPEDIKKLITHIQKHFPEGCTGVECKECVLRSIPFDNDYQNLCELLASMRRCPDVATREKQYKEWIEEL